MNEPDKQEVKDVLQATLRRLVWATVIVYAVLVLLGAYIYLNARTQRGELASVVEQTTSALCTFRADLETRVETSENFLEENPDGIPGITPELIQQGIDNQQRTIDALNDLICPPREL